MFVLSKVFASSIPSRISLNADDIDLLVPQYCDIDLATEFDNIQRWATDNKMIINRSKTYIFVAATPQSRTLP